MPLRFYFILKAKMVNNNNSSLTKELIEGGRLQVIQGVPQSINNFIQPVMEVNPKLLRACNIVKRATATNATTATIYTTPATQDFYLVAAAISYIKDVTSTSVFSRINITIDGVNVTLLEIPGITLTPATGQMSLNLTFPIKIDRGTNISVNNSTNVANINAIGTIVGYVVDNTNA